MSSYGSGAVVTPEAVRLDFQAAGLGSRGASQLIDITITLMTLWIVLFSVGLILETDAVGLSDTAATVTLFILGFLLTFGYPVAFETLWHGRTPGKAAMGLRVVTVEGGPVRFRHAAIRGALLAVDILLLGVPAFLAMLISRRHQRLGDMAAGTMVLRERMAAGPTHVAQFRVPHGLEGYAETIDASGLSQEDYAVIRSFLLRAASLSLDVRERLARQLATTFAQRLSAVPPRDLGAEQFLVTLAARYQQRSAAYSGGPEQGWAAAAQPSEGSAPPAPRPQPAQGPQQAPAPQQLGDFIPPR